ncbi:MAG: hypothetical protein V4509_01690 [Patescibacteria group bacterium]
MKKTKIKINTKPRVFTNDEYEILFNALDVYATEIHDARYQGEVDDYGTKAEVKVLLKRIEKLETKLNTL